MKIVLPNKIKKNIYNYVKKDYPKESCGLLIGSKKNNILICKEAINTINIAKNPYKFFEIDFKDIIKIQKQFRKNKLSIIGHYHSHPNSNLSSNPSKKDIESIYDRNLCWLIIGINADAIELSAYFPEKFSNNTYNLKRITIN